MFEALAEGGRNFWASLKKDAEASHAREVKMEGQEAAMVRRFEGKGGGTPEAIRAALGNYADIHKGDDDVDWKVDATKEGITEEEARTREFSRDYREGYRIDPAKDEKLVGNLDNPAQRLVVLKQLTQQGEDGNATDGAECGPSSLIGGALLAGGTQGLELLMSATLKNCSEENKEKLAKDMEGIKAAIKEGKLNFGHLQALQEQVYTVLQRDMDGEDPKVMKEGLEQMKLPEEQRDVTKLRAARNFGGIKYDTINNFLASSPDLKDQFAKNGLSIGHVDTVGQEGTRANHFVLDIADASGKKIGVYDPAARRGGQLVTGKREVESYAIAEARQMTGAPMD